MPSGAFSDEGGGSLRGRQKRDKRADRLLSAVMRWAAMNLREATRQFLVAEGFPQA